MSELIILVKLLCAHFCSDFVLQTDNIYKGKSIGGYKGMLYHALHSLIHAIISYLFVAEWTNWMIPLAIFVTHFTIDFIKYLISANYLDSRVVNGSFVKKTRISTIHI